jgi:hypothetical protein
VPKIIEAADQRTELHEVSELKNLVSGSWCRQDGRVTLCVDLPRGDSEIRFVA